MLKNQSAAIGLALMLALACYAVPENFSSQRPFAESNCAKESNEAAKTRQQDEPWWQRAREPIAFFTLCLVLVGGAQLGLFYRQLTFIRQSLVDAKTAADAAKESADATKIQADVARDSLDKVQRPYIYIFGVGRPVADTHIGWGTPHVRYSVANYGNTPARIDNINIGFFGSSVVGLAQRDTVPDLIDRDHSLIVSPVLPPQDLRKDLAAFLPEEFIGENLGATVIIDGRRNMEISIPEPLIPLNELLFFRVIVRYSGPFTRGYETSAVWFYDPSASLFSAWNDERYTYMR
jgi:hypothetical protein